MVELKCKNCGSPEIEYKDRMWICHSCGSKYLPGETDINKISEEKKLEEKISDICEEIEETDDSQEGLFDKLFKKLDMVSDRLIEINENNPYAMTAKMLIRIYNGINDSASAERFITYIETAVNHSDKEAKYNTWDCLEKHLDIFRAKVLEKNPELELRVNGLISMFSK